jgi:hypothetical protein
MYECLGLCVVSDVYGFRASFTPDGSEFMVRFAGRVDIEMTNMTTTLVKG